MHLTVKVLNGEECVVSASPSSLVTDIKEQVSALLSVPVPSQRLTLKGKILTDNKKLCDYDIKDGARIMLTVKKTDIQESFVVSSPNWKKLSVFLKRHFKEKDADLVLKEFIKNFEKGVSSLSLDDIERLAAHRLQSNSD
ncbi:hypothetical protein LOTGIDRAFT_174210 [Lottia gigantea]|uniref:Ubiquitin-like domain-containing protein n=1 Tax=Lottia gigantea TaxID=225164 RepID=V4C9T3_LOTGI|nr:hypothetical protein LOTGIDRAFT_174210 [Lottia gigantea]ESO98524.1 hypothetical protein LOTGIDRAFT_174210 [Lottia gigantea]